MSEVELHGLYTWVDEVPFSRPKRSITRDFADGVLMAELMRHYLPKLVQLHNYSAANGYRQKAYNWQTLNQKVFKKIGMTLRPNDIDKVVNGEIGAIERILKLARLKIADYHGRMTAKKGCETPDRSRTGVSGIPGYGAECGVVKSISCGGVELGRREGAGGMLYADQKQLTDSQSLVIEELRDTNQLLEAKISKMEQLLRLKDAKINTLIGLKKEELVHRA